jgi:hypothetical protein
MIVILSLVALVASGLACGPTTAQPQAPPATVTPYVPDTTTAEPTAEPTAETAADPTDTPEPTATNTPQPPPPPTNTPEPVSEGPLSFDKIEWVHAWEPLEGGDRRVYLKVIIRGGAPPFTISHGANVHGTTSEREYIVDRTWSTCNAAMIERITVESADGQSYWDEYYIPVDRQPWCD